VLRWYHTIYPSIGHLIHLINTEKKDVLSYGSPGDNAIGSKGGQQRENRGKILFKTLNILKNGLYSRNHEVQGICGLVFSSVIEEIIRLQSDMEGDAWDWFVTNTLQPEFKKGSPNIGSHLLPLSGKK